MKPETIVIAIRRFWPLMGPTETAACSLASALRQRGHQVHLITVAWQKNWPHHFQFREFEVHRICRPLAGPFGSFRYARALIRKIGDIQPTKILMYGLGEELAAVRKAVGPDVQIVVRPDCRLLGERKSQKNFSLAQASHVMCDSQRTLNDLQQRRVGLPSSVFVLPDGMPVGEELTPVPTTAVPIGKAGSRMAVTDAHPVLRIEPGQPLVVSGAPMDRDQGLIDLIAAWDLVSVSHPEAKLWLLGDGPRGRQVWEAVVAAGLADTIIMPGFFDDHQEIFQAADLYVHPTRQATNCSCLFAAIAARLCVVTTEGSFEPLPVVDQEEKGGESHLQLVHDESALIASAQDPIALAHVICNAIEDPVLRHRLGHAGAAAFRNAIDVETMVDQFLQATKAPESGHAKELSAAVATSEAVVEPESMESS